MLVLLGPALVAPALSATAPRVEDLRYALGKTLPPESSELWTSAPFTSVPGSESELWIRARIEIESFDATAPLGLRLDALATCEIFWDELALPKQGRVGPIPEEELPGPIRQIAYLPSPLAGAGSHDLLLHCSTHHRGFSPSQGFWVLAVGPYHRLLTAERTSSWIALLSFSGMILTAGYFFVLFLLDQRSRPDLLIALLSLAGAALLIAESWRRLFGYTYDWHLLRLLAVTLLSWLVCVLLVAFLVSRFPNRRRGVTWVLGVALLSALPVFLFRSWDAKATSMFLVALPAGLLWCLIAMRRRQPGSRLAAIGVAICFGVLIAAPFRFIDSTLYPALDLLLLFLLFAHARQVRAARRERQEARLRASRLEAELLRRHLQPHFLMNTLTAIQEWIEEEPRRAVELIEALADEMRTLGDLAARSRVRLEEELRLCRSHLQVLGYRQDTTYRLATEGLDPEEEVPPAIFHTLVENAVTHGSDEPGEVVLELAADRQPGRRRYVFRSPWQGDGGAAEREGSGLRYVRARLSEAYGRAWRLDQRAEGGFWVTEITLLGES